LQYIFFNPVYVLELLCQWLKKNFPHGSIPGESGKLRGTFFVPCKGEGFSRHKVQKMYLMPVSFNESAQARAGTGRD